MVTGQNPTQQAAAGAPRLLVRAETEKLLQYAGARALGLPKPFPPMSCFYVLKKSGSLLKASVDGQLPARG